MAIDMVEQFSQEVGSEIEFHVDVSLLGSKTFKAKEARLGSGNIMRK